MKEFVGMCLYRTLNKSLNGPEYYWEAVDWVQQYCENSDPVFFALAACSGSDPAQSQTHTLTSSILTPLTTLGLLIRACWLIQGLDQKLKVTEQLRWLQDVDPVDPIKKLRL